MGSWDGWLIYHPILQHFCMKWLLSRLASTCLHLEAWDFFIITVISSFSVIKHFNCHLLLHCDILNISAMSDQVSNLISWILLCCSQLSIGCIMPLCCMYVLCLCTLASYPYLWFGLVLMILFLRIHFHLFDS